MVTSTLHTIKIPALHLLHQPKHQSHETKKQIYKVYDDNLTAFVFRRLFGM